MSTDYEIIIAGAGIAGLTAAIHAARLGRRTLLLTGHVPGGHLISINCIDGYPGYPDGVPGYDLCPMAQDQAMAAGAEMLPAMVESIAKTENGFTLNANGKQYTSGAVILATGSDLKELGINGETEFHGKGVSHCASCDAPALRGQVVAVVGGGDSALQEALTLAEHVSKVIIIHRGSQFRAQQDYIQRIQDNPKIESRFHSTIEEILGGDAVTAVKVNQDGESSNLDVAAVFVFIGLQPNSHVVADLLELDKTSHVPVDQDMQTSVPGLFAAGLVRSGAAGRAVGSAGDGAVAATAAHRYLG